MYTIQPEVSKNSILDVVPQEQIFEKYLGIPVQFTESVCSPLRKDKTPTCGFRYAKSGLLYFRDFSGHFWGNCFDLVMLMYGVDYDMACKIIAKDFNVLQIELGEMPRLQPINPPEHLIKEKARFEISWRKYGRLDLLYWNRFQITESELYEMKVAPVNALWINEYLNYGYNPYDPCYAIVLAPGEYKLYFPYSTTRRFLCNTNLVMGIQQLPAEGELVIITKSFKDIMVLKKFHIPAIAWQGEGMMPDKETIEKLKKRFDHTYSLYDFDLTGIRTANKMRKIYGIHPLFFTNSRFGYHNCEAKDAAEYIEKHGMEKSKILYNNFIKVMVNDDTNPF